MPGLIERIDSAVQGLDLAQLAGGLAGQIASLGGEFGSWAKQPPGDFGQALSGLPALTLRSSTSLLTSATRWAVWRQVCKARSVH